MKNHTINQKVIQRVAKALGGLNKEVLYVGGAVVGLYIDDPAAEDVRPTKDIDISLSIATSAELEEIRQALHERGFRQYPEDDVVCRFRFEDIKVDVMSTKAVDWAPSNRWFEPAFDAKEEVQIEEQRIFIPPLPFYLASKFEAFKDRGSKDPRTSHDLEDIVFVLNYRKDFSTEILKAPNEVLDFLKAKFKAILESAELQEAVRGHLYYENIESRYKRLMEEMTKVVEA